MIRFIVNVLIINFILIQYSYADNFNGFQFTDEEFKKLKIRKVRGAKAETIYTLGSNENGNYLKAETKDGAASGLGKEIKVNIEKTPYINITWKIEKDLKGINEKTKKGHDYAARVFVIKKTGYTPLSNKAINYVFSSNNSVDEHWRSPYTKSSVDYVLSTTKNSFNEWITVKANVKKHFKELHDLDVKELSGLAIMTDTDQTNKNVVAYYQNIYFSED